MRLFIIANRLPVRACRKGGEVVFSPSEGGLATGLKSLNVEMEAHWIGWPGLYADTPQDASDMEAYLRDQRLHPVFLSQEQIMLYYEGYSNSVLWPLSHYFVPLARYRQESWSYYRQVNECFCRKVLEMTTPEDVLWVQDYQLMLLPAMLREHRPLQSIGYFHHIPFPSYELLRILPERETLLEGLLGADLIGFHTHEYMRHFIYSVERALDLEIDGDSLRIGHRTLQVDAFPMGIDYRLFSEASQRPEIQQQAWRLRKDFGQGKLVLSVDRLDYSKGILHKLQGFEHFLSSRPDYMGKVSLVMVLVPSRENVEQYAALKAQVDQMIGNINGQYSTPGWRPVYYFYHSFDFEELVALYHIADIALVTPLRDGMNLVAKEYVAAKNSREGVLILSEMAGASIELQGALKVNPNDIPGISQALGLALDMPMHEQRRRMSDMQDFLQIHHVQYWAEGFLERLQALTRDNQERGLKRWTPLLEAQLCQEYRGADRRLLILDYDGTLVPLCSSPEMAVPSQQLRHLLQALCWQTGNVVVISSGRDRRTLSSWLGGIPGLVLVAEHGASYCVDGGEWVTDCPVLDAPDILEVLKDFAMRTPGSFVEQKQHAWVWHYRNVAPWLGRWRGEQLIKKLVGLCSRQGLQVVHGNKIVEIKHAAYTKASIATYLMESLGPFGFIMALGDDTTDEDTFMALPPNAFSICVGNNHTAARYYMSAQTEVTGLLSRLLSHVPPAGREDAC